MEEQKKTNAFRSTGNVWFSEQFHKWRVASGLTSSEVARALKENRTTISNWEYRVSSPQPYKIIRICKLFRITPNDFFDWPTEDKGAAEVRKYVAFGESAQLFDSLNDAGKQEVDKYIRLLKRNPTYTRKTKSK